MIQMDSAGVTPHLSRILPDPDLRRVSSPAVRALRRPSPGPGALRSALSPHARTRLHPPVRRVRGRGLVGCSRGASEVALSRCQRYNTLHFLYVLGREPELCHNPLPGDMGTAIFLAGDQSQAFQYLDIGVHVLVVSAQFFGQRADADRFEGV